MPILGTIASSYRASSPAGGLAFESIATGTGTGSSNTITFSSIPQTFKHLQIRYIARMTGANTGYGFYLRVNGDSGSSYLRYWARGRQDAASIAGDNGFQTQMSIAGVPGANSSANIMGMGVIDIFDYTSTAKLKSFKYITGVDQNQSFSDTYTLAGAGLWNSTSAITSLSFTGDDGSSLTTATKIYLYGIKG